jgi:hypothetical protein
MYPDRTIRLLSLALGVFAGILCGRRDTGSGRGGYPRLGQPGSRYHSEDQRPVGT